MKRFINKDQDFTVGETCGHLTITSVKPFKQRCSCGTETSWTRTALVTNGVRSCGCQQTNRKRKVPPRFEAGKVVGIFELLDKVDVVRRKWLVRCTRCLNERELSEQYLYYAPPRHCENCP